MKHFVVSTSAVTLRSIFDAILNPLHWFQILSAIWLIVSTSIADSKAVGGATGGAVGFSTGAIGGFGTGLGGVPVGGVKGYTGGFGWPGFGAPVGGFVPFAFPFFGRR
jgi:hypothetical protein